MPKRSTGLSAIVIAQFLSVFADNALLFLGIALLRAMKGPSWQIPLLEQVFLLGFVFLAPFVGLISDRLPKARVMLLSNWLKLFGALAMWAGAHPLVAYAVVGVGGVTYAIAKRSILVERIASAELVKANGTMEGLSIVAILLGSMTGGFLADYSMALAWLIVGGLYLVSAAVNFLVPKSDAALQVGAEILPINILRKFVSAMRILFSDRETAVALFGSSMAWALGATLRIVAVIWASTILGRNDLGTPALLNGAIAIGIAGGALFGARLFQLHKLQWAFALGMFAGVSVFLFAFVKTLPMAFLVLVLLGGSVGSLLIPMHAILQYRGKHLVGTGTAVSIQAFVEYGAAIALLGILALYQKAGYSLFSFDLTLGLGATVALFLMALKPLSMTAPYSGRLTKSHPEG